MIDTETFLKLQMVQQKEMMRANLAESKLEKVKAELVAEIELRNEFKKALADLRSPCEYTFLPKLREWETGCGNVRVAFIDYTYCPDCGHPVHLQESW